MSLIDTLRKTQPRWLEDGLGIRGLQESEQRRGSLEFPRCQFVKDPPIIEVPRKSPPSHGISEVIATDFVCSANLVDVEGVNSGIVDDLTNAAANAGTVVHTEPNLTVCPITSPLPNDGRILCLWDGGGHIAKLSTFCARRVTVTISATSSNAWDDLANTIIDVDTRVIGVSSYYGLPNGAPAPDAWWVPTLAEVVYAVNQTEAPLTPDPIPVGSYLQVRIDAIILKCTFLMQFNTTTPVHNTPLDSNFNNYPIYRVAPGIRHDVAPQTGAQVVANTTCWRFISAT